MYNSNNKKKYEFGEIEIFIDPNFKNNEEEIKNNNNNNNFDECIICNNKSEDTYWIQCDNCNYWYHFECVGIEPNEFICNLCKKDKKKYKIPKIVEILNSIYNIKEYHKNKSFQSKILKNQNDDNFSYHIYAPDGNEMKNIIILYSCGKEYKDLIRNKNENKNENSKKFVNDFKITNIQFCTREDHINQLQIPYFNNQDKSYPINLEFYQFLNK